jgi:hypothetical protein
LLCACLQVAAGAQLHFEVVNRQVVESRLHDFSGDDGVRETTIKKMFTGAGCAKEISEQVVKHSQQPNLICVLPGQSDFTVVVGAHFDHVTAGDGVVDNWSGASLLPSLFQGCTTRRIATLTSLLHSPAKKRVSWGPKPTSIA